MLTGLKVLSLAYKYVFYRPEHNTKGSYGILKVLKCKNEKYQWIELDE